MTHQFSNPGLGYSGDEAPKMILSPTRSEQLAELKQKTVDGDFAEIYVDMLRNLEAIGVSEEPMKAYLDVFEAYFGRIFNNTMPGDIDRIWGSWRPRTS